MISIPASKKRQTALSVSSIIRKLTSFHLPKDIHIQKLLKPNFFGVIGCISFLVLSTYLLFGDTLTIKKIDCYIDGLPCYSDLNSLFKPLIGERIMFFSGNSIRDSILFDHPQLQTVTFHPQIPDTLGIRIFSRQPIAVLEDLQGNRYLLDEALRIYAQGDKENTVKIKTQESVIIGETVVSPALTKAVELELILSRSLVAATLIDVKGYDDITVVMPFGYQVIFSAEKDFTKQVDALQYILNNSKMDTHKQVMIDLRYDNPVVK